MTKHITLATVIIGLSLFLATDLSAQVISGRGFSGATRLTYFHWNIDNGTGRTSISQSSVPVSGFVPVRENLEILFHIASASNDIEMPAGNKNSLSGATDVRFQANQSLWNDHLLLSAGVNLPTGKTKLNYDTDTSIINLLSQNFISVPVRRLGRGTGFNFLVGGATQLGELYASAGFKFEYAGPYDPYQSFGEYDPGESFNVTLSAQKRQRRRTLYGDIGIAFYADDKFQGEKVFRQSTQISFRIGGAFSFGTANDASLSLRYVWRGNNRSYGASDAPASERQLFGDEYHLTGSLLYRIDRAWSVGPIAELQYIDHNQEVGNLRLSSSYLVGLGGSVSRNLTDQLTIDVRSQYFFGQADGDRLDITGYQLTVGLGARL